MEAHQLSDDARLDSYPRRDVVNKGSTVTTVSQKTYSICTMCDNRRASPHLDLALIELNLKQFLQFNVRSLVARIASLDASRLDLWTGPNSTSQKFNVVKTRKLLPMSRTLCTSQRHHVGVLGAKESDGALRRGH